MKRKRNAIIYARQSSGNDEKSVSVETQIINCTNLCNENNLNIKNIFSDLNVSGRTYPKSAADLARKDMAFTNWYKHQTKNKEFREGLDGALSAMDTGDVLVLDDLTRLYRGIRNGFLGSYIKQVLEGKQIQVLTVKNGKFNPADFNDSLVEDIQTHVNDEQIKISKNKSMEARQHMKDQGVLAGGVRVVGLEYLGNHQYRVRDSYREVIVFIYESIIAEKSYSQIQREVNERYLSLFSKHFYESNFYHIAKQPLYAGYMRNSAQEPIKCTGLVGEPAISFEQWCRVQDIMEQKRKAPVSGVRGRNVLPFSRKCVCGYCGSNMVIAKDKKSLAYFCKGGSNLAQNKNCMTARVRISETSSKFYTGLKNALAPLLVLGQYKLCLEYFNFSKNREKCMELEKRTWEMGERLKEVTVDYISGNLDRTVFDEARKKAEKLLEKMKGELATLKMKLKIDYRKNMEDDPLWGNFTAIMNYQLDDGKYKELFDRVVEKIVCYNDKVSVITKFGTFDLERLVTRKGRSFPRYTWTLLYDDKSIPKDISKCRIKVIYHYLDNRAQKIKINFPILKVYEED